MSVNRNRLNTIFPNGLNWGKTADWHLDELHQASKDAMEASDRKENNRYLQDKADQDAVAAGMTQSAADDSEEGQRLIVEDRDKLQAIGKKHGRTSIEYANEKTRIAMSHSAFVQASQDWQNSQVEIYKAKGGPNVKQDQAQKVWDEQKAIKDPRKRDRNLATRFSTDPEIVNVNGWVTDALDSSGKPTPFAGNYQDVNGNTIIYKGSAKNGTFNPQTGKLDATEIPDDDIDKIYYSNKILADHFVDTHTSDAHKAEHGGYNGFADEERVKLFRDYTRKMANPRMITYEEKFDEKNSVPVAPDNSVAGKKAAADAAQKKADMQALHEMADRESSVGAFGTKFKGKVTAKGTLRTVKIKGQPAHTYDLSIPSDKAAYVGDAYEMSHQAQVASPEGDKVKKKDEKSAYDF